MSQANLSFPDSTYTSSNKPSADTLKSDLSVIETAHNETDTAAVRTDDVTLAGSSFFLDEDDMGSDSAVKVSSQQSIKAYVDAAITAAKSALLPVGSIYTNESVATNPATLLGFGTWVAYGAGRVMVGKAGSGTFDTAGEELGAETHALSEAELASHTHVQTAHTHVGANSPRASVGIDTGSNYVGEIFMSGLGIATGSTTAENASTGSGTAHTNLQPSITAYLWKRTA